ncbi:hypothetical protein [Conexibacter arvalis]|uniref:hypothetical protein n=1 Tax=Conexibacter arvalis TaxID=912552 RepID=UPI001620A204|nr:hypothetical protein [Conexibacter arvalis]
MTVLLPHGSGDSDLDCAEAASLLDVPANALRSWSERLSFPHDVGGAGSPRFRRSEIEALRDALPLSHSVSGAIHAARLRVHG